MYIFYNKNVAIVNAIKFTNTFGIEIAVMDRGNGVYQMQLNQTVLKNDIDSVVYITK